MNLQKMSIDELQALNKEVEQTIINKKNNLSFWDEVERLNELKIRKQEVEKSIEDFEDSSKYISDVKAIGFSVVVHEKNRIAFIDYSKETLEDQFYVIEYSQETGELKPRRNDVSEGDIDTLRAILEMD